MKCYSSDEPALGLKAMYAKVIVLPKRDLNYKLKLISNDDWCKKKKKKKKKVRIFLDLCVREN